MTRRRIAALLAAATAAGALLLGAGPAAAAPGTATGIGGQTLTVSQVDGIDPDGTTVTVTGSGYDTSKGIYVAFCVMPAPGQLPTPCGGGAATSGSGGLSGWVSSNPPSYGKDLATPFGAGGTFSMPMTLTAMIGSVDCRTTSCSVVTRADHTRTDDRSADVVVPIAFGAPGSAGSPETTTAAPPTSAEPTAAPTSAATTSAAPTSAAPASTAPSTRSTAATAPPASAELTLSVSDPASASSRDDDAGMNAAIVIIGGVLAVLAVGGAGWLAMKRKQSRGGAGGGP